MSIVRPCKDVISELLCRFIVNLPEKELQPDRIFFHMQEAYWFYLDFILHSSNQPYLNLKAFSQVLFEDCPFIICPGREFNTLYNGFRDYQGQIPRYGAILLNQTLDKVLLVMNWKQTSYSFPKGQINQGETEIDCAAREVWEEIGYSLTNTISEKDFIEILLHGQQLNKMYIMPGVPERTEFRTKTRYEIGKIEWVKLENIENHHDNKRNPFRNIQPFVTSLKLWIKSFKEKVKSKTPTLNPRLNTQEKFSGKICEFDKKLREISKKFEENAEKNPLKAKISLPSFEIYEQIPEEDTNFIEKTTSFVKIKEKNSRILLKKDQKFSSVEKFAKKLQEIALKSFNSLTINEKSEEINPFLSFNLDKPVLSTIFSS